MNESTKVMSEICHNYAKLLTSQNHGSEEWVLMLAKFIFDTHKDLTGKDFNSEEYKVIKGLFVAAYYHLINYDPHGLYDYLIFTLKGKQNVQN